MSNDLLSVIFREAIGYEPLTRMTVTQERFPHYNIIKKGDVYDIELAVAGFSNEELEVQVDNGFLTVTGTKTQTEAVADVEVLHSGIAYRDFKRTWKLGEYIEVSTVELKDGILTINLFRNTPEEKKPKTFTIN